jgi:signal transduction histidine kinase/allophanate hydrolase subunit 1
MKKILIIAILLIFSALLICNEAVVDSLTKLLGNSPDRQKVHILNELGKVYWGESSEETFRYSRDAHELAKRIGYKKGEAQSLNNIGVGYYFLQDYDNALDYFKQALEIRRKLGDKKEIVASLNNIGIVYDEINDFEKALDYYLQSLQYFEDLEDEVGTAVTLHNVGVVYESLSNYNKSLEYLLRALKLYEEIGDKTGVASSYGNIGIVYKDLSNYDKSLEYHLKSLKISREIGDKNGIANSLDNIGIIYETLNNYDKAIEYYLQSMEIEEEIGDIIGVASSLNNIGIIYDDQKKYNKALEYYIRSLEMNEDIGYKNGVANSLNNIGVVYENLKDFEKSLGYHQRALIMFQQIGFKKGYAASLNNIGTVYLMLKDYDQALEYLEQSLAVALEIETKDLTVEIYKKLSDLYSDQHNYREALFFFKLYSSIKDSIFTKEKIEKISGMQTTYEVEHLLEQQETQIELLQKDNEIYKLFVEKQTLVKWRLYMILFMMAVLAFVIFYFYRTKYKANILLRELVDERTKDLTISNKNLKNEIKERKKIEYQLIRSERLAGVGELAAGIAHEIRNPLGNISSSAQFCMGKYEMDDNLKRYLKIIMEESDKANSIIMGLLDFANPREMNLKKGSINNVLESVVKSVAARCQEYKIKVIQELIKDMPEIILDKKWLEQALLNLIVNSLQAMLEGGVLKIKEKVMSDQFQIIISDTGVGISDKDFKKIFDPFFTTKEEGVGLGLSLAHQIIIDHNGRLQIESELGKGTDVIISFKYR